MTAEDEFTRDYVTSSEIGRRLRVTRTAVIQARQKGRLPAGILVENHLMIWKRDTVEPYILQWEERRKERAGA